MKRNLTVSIGILSAFAFLVAFFLGIGVSSQTVWKEIVPFLAIMLAITLAISGKSCCRARRNC